MTFPGIPDPQTRANVIAWLRTLSHDPVPLPEVTEAAPGAAGPAALPPVGPMLASANPKAGEAFAKTICLICHTVNEGGPAIIGPNLYNVVGGPHAHMTGYAYSAAMKGKSGPWNYEELNRWLYKPSEYAPGPGWRFRGCECATAGERDCGCAVFRRIRAAAVKKGQGLCPLDPITF